jgi:WD40 repeat protein
MGLFEVRRQLAAESKSKTIHAKKQAASVGSSVDQLVLEVWASELDPKVVEPMFRSVAKKNEELALALARLDARNQESNRAIFEENATLVSPLLASWLETDRGSWAAQMLGQMRDPASIPALRRTVENTKDAQRRAFAMHALAMFGNDDALSFVTEHVQETTPQFVIVELARRGVGPMVTRAIGIIRSWLDGRKGDKRQDRDDAEGSLRAMEALGDARAQEALSTLHEVLDTPYSPTAYAALANLADPSSREPVTRQLSLLGGDRERNWPYRLGAESVLRSLGDTLPLDEARAVVAWSHPRRYGWPKNDDHALLMAVAANALLSGTPEDLEKVARLAACPMRVLRKVGAVAFEKVHGKPPILRYFDPERAKRFVAEESATTVLQAIESGTAVFRHNLVKGLAASKDKSGKRELTEVCVHALESTLNHAVNYYEESDLGADANGFIDAVELLVKVPELKKRLETSSSLWIAHHLFKKDPSAWPSLPEPTGTVTASTRRLGSRADGAFAIGRHTNGIALSHDGARLAVVGSELGVILDAQSGKTLVELVLKYNWAYDAIFSKDDLELIVAYHGGHVEVFDTNTGQRLRSLEGHGGVPDGVKRVAVSPDGKRLLSVGADSRAILWNLASGKAMKKWADEKGSFEACAFTHDGARFVVSHVKSSGGANYLLLCKADGTSKRVPMPSSMWATVFMKDGTLVTAGEGGHIFFWNEKFKEVRKLSQKQVVRLVLSEDEKSLFALSQSGELHRWNLVSGKATALDLGEGQTWALARDPKSGMVFVAGTSGVLHRFDATDKKLQTAPLVIHTGQVRGVHHRPDGSFITCGWDGRLIAWKANGSPDRLLHQVDGRMTEMTVHQSTLYVVGAETILCFEVESGALLCSRKEKAESIAVSRDGKVLAAGYYGGALRTFNTVDLSPIKEISTGKAEVSSLSALADGWLMGTDDGRVMGLSLDLDVRWTLARHGRDLVEGEPMGNPHKTVMWVESFDGGFISAATDHTVRLWTPDQRQVKRWLSGSGLFNNATVSTAGDRVAVVSSWTLDVFDAKTGETLVHMGRVNFPGVDELTRASWRNDHEILVGAENGNVYLVSLGGA